MKYRLTGETIKKDGFTLYRIQATKDFGNIRKGDLGGFVERADRRGKNQPYFQLPYLCK